MLEILFIDKESGRVKYAITSISVIRYITPSEVGFTYLHGRNSSCPFLHTERIEIAHKTHEQALRKFEARWEGAGRA